MRLYSTVESAEAREISLLAIGETLIAVSIGSFLISIGIWHTLAMTALAPFLLLRSSFSTSLGITMFDRFSNLIIDQLHRNNYARFAALLLLLPITVVAIKTAATVAGFFRHPIESVAAIPANWVRYTMCTDTAHTPEAIPGAELSGKFIALPFSFSGFIRSCRGLFENDQITGTVIPSIMMVCVAPIFALSVLYRYSLKSTAVVWLPLLLIAPKFKPVEPLIVRLRSVNRTSWGRFVALLSAMIISAFVAKVLLYNGVLHISNDWFAGSLGDLLRKYIEPTIIPWWQAASVLNSVIALAVFFWASEKLIHLEAASDSDRNRTGADVFMRCTSVVRTILSVYTCVCLATLVALHVDLIKLPPFGDRAFPWM